MDLVDWKALPRVTMPMPDNIWGGKSTSSRVQVPQRFFVMPLRLLTSARALASIFFYRYVAPGANGELHHILSCSEPVYSDADHPSLSSLCATTLLGSPRTLVVRPVSLRINLQPYPLLPTASPRKATMGSRDYRKSAAHLSPVQLQNTSGYTARDVFPPQMSHARQPPLYPLRTLLGIRRYSKVYIFLSNSSFHLRQCPMLRVQFVESYWPNSVYNVRRVRSGASLFSGRRMTRRFPPHHLKLYKRLGGGEFGKVLNGMVSAPQSRIKYNVVAKLLLRAHLDKLYNEIGIYQTPFSPTRQQSCPQGVRSIRGSGLWGVGAGCETMRHGALL